MENAFEGAELEQEKKPKSKAVKWLACCGIVGVLGVVAIGIIAVFVGPKIAESLNEAFAGSVKADVMRIDQVLDSYAAKNGGRYPESFGELLAPDENGERYLDAEVADPWQRPYVFEAQADGSRPIIWTYGQDGELGGEGLNRDLSSEMARNGEF